MSELIVLDDSSKPDTVRWADPDKPNWDAHMGNNYNHIKALSRWGGGISFKEHLGQPLSDKLWKDVVGRLGVGRIHVFRPGDVLHIRAYMNEVLIHMDEEGNVKDIDYHP